MIKNGCPSKFEQFARQYTIITVLFLTPHIEDTMSKVRLTTNLGAIVIELNAEKAPKTVANFIEYVKAGHYDGTIFHRVIPNFMIQGGDPTGTGRGGPGYTFKDEFDPKLKHDKPGVLSMANAGPGTDGSQFFLTFVPAPWLDGKHTIFGEVVSGSDTLKALEQCGSPAGRPTEKLTITKATVSIEPAAPAKE